MSEFNIKISELNRITPNPPFPEDFFPLVHSASMTTYRATLQDIGSLITQSISASYSETAITSISASWASASISASYARTASYAISASHAIIADSASYYPLASTVISCSWASRSLQSWYATRSLDVDTHGTEFRVPWWNTNDIPGTNGALESSSPLFFSQSQGDNRYGPFVIDPDWSFQFVNDYNVPSPITYPWFSQSGWWNVHNNARPTDPSPDPATSAGVGGLFSPWPIVSGIFCGTDQKSWYFSTASALSVENTIWSGSYAAGSRRPLDRSYDQIFNGKWLRIAVTNAYPDFPVTPYLAENVAAGETPGSWNHTGMFGRMRLRIGSSNYAGGSNKTCIVDFDIENYYWSSHMSARVNHVENVNLIKAIRLTKVPSNQIYDPFQTIDILLDGFTSSDHIMDMTFQSWGGIRFLNFPNLDPPQLRDSGSNDIHQDTNQLMFPARPGFYSTYTSNADYNTYNIFGRNVVIDPTSNEITASGMMTQFQQSLNVSGGINTNTQFYCNNTPGLTTRVTYGTTNLYFSGGILVGKVPP